MAIKHDIKTQWGYTANHWTLVEYKETPTAAYANYELYANEDYFKAGTEAILSRSFRFELSQIDNLDVMVCLDKLVEELLNKENEDVRVAE